jgi:serpin B
MKHVFSALALMGLLLTGCLIDKTDSGKNNAVTGSQLLKSSLARAPITGVPDADVSTLAAGNSNFAFDLYAQIRSNSGNLACSPYSISLALAMTYGGARAQTDSAMAGTMHFTLGQTALHPAFNRLDQELMSRGAGAQGREGAGFKLSLVNALWGQNNFTFHTDYLDLLAADYGAGMHLLDFISQAEACRVTINDSVSFWTNQKIRDLIPTGALDASTRLVLTNTVYFDAMWQDTFEHKNTFPQYFYRSVNDSALDSTMSRIDTMSYAEGADWQALELPYDGNEMSMVIFLPKAGQYDAFEASLNSQVYNSIIALLAPRYVNLHLPKFNITTSSFSLAPVLKSLGMSVAFSDLADFSGISDNPLYIGNVIHKAFVAVDEKGTTAAAATAIILETLSFHQLPETPVDFIANRPFVYLIRDKATNTILFLGRVSDPGL